jgi:hypothetical protein
MSANNSLVATFADPDLAEATILKLQHSGVDMSKMAIVGRGQPIMAGELRETLRLGGMRSLSAEQASCIPVDNLEVYEAELGANRVLLVAHGTPDEVDLTKRIIESVHPESWDGKVGCSIYYGCGD